MSRKKNSTIDDLTDLIAMLPWWAGVVLGLVIYIVLHRVTQQQVVTAAQPGQIDTMVTHTVWRAFANIGQYVLPVIFFIGAGLSALKRRERKTLVDNVVQSKGADVLDGMSWQQFERLVGEAFRLQGYSVTETGGGGADGGVDLILSKGGEKFLVQCKQWRAFRVGVDVMRELYGVMAAKGATGGYVVTSGRFTDDATSFASGRNVELIDGPKLHALIQQAQAARQGGTGSATSPTMRSRPASPASASSVPTCPLCSRPMVKRTARRGAGAGGEFWGCTGYPECRGTRDAA